MLRQCKRKQCKLRRNKPLRYINFVLKISWQKINKIEIANQDTNKLITYLYIFAGMTTFNINLKIFSDYSKQNATLNCLLIFQNKLK